MSDIQSHFSPIVGSRADSVFSADRDSTWKT